MESETDVTRAVSGGGLLSFSLVAAVFEVQANGIVTTPQEPFRLLDLTPELSNRIYGFALTEKSDIVVTATLRPPGLLSACRQIRNETKFLWHLSNTFRMQFTDRDTAAMNQAFRKSVRRSVGTKHVINVVILTRIIRVDWTDPMNWCYLVWNNELFPCKPQDKCKKIASIIHAAQVIAAGNMNETWEVCKVQLEAFRVVAGLLDERWLN